MKYRPKKWTEFVGQEQTIAQLKHLAESGTCPNMILYGPYGTGKSSASFVFSRAFLGSNFASNFKSLNIRDVSEYTISKAKRDIKALAKLDRSERTELDEYMSIVFREVKADLKAKGRTRDPNKSQLLQGAIKFFASTVTVADEMVKILVLDEADALTSSMQQALRRTMEIFSESCRFIFVTPSVAGWSPAILSRCLLLRFPAFPEEVVSKHIKKIATKEGVKIDAKALKAIATESDGDMRRAINLLQIAAATGRPVTEDEVYACSDTPLTAGVRQVVDLAIIGSYAKARKEVRRLLALEGYSHQEVLLQIERELVSRPFEPVTLNSILERVAEIDFRMTQARNPFIHMAALIASIGRITNE